MKHQILAAVLVTAGLAGPAFAQATCDDANLQKAQAQIDAMTDPAQAAGKETAMKELELAKTAKNEGNAEACATHIGNAVTASMPQ